jgi:hypothetical protein
MADSVSVLAGYLRPVLKEDEMKTRPRLSKILFLPLAALVLLSTLLIGEPQRGMGGMRAMGSDHREDMRRIHASLPIATGLNARSRNWLMA